jgi:chaperonin cofactor prefoldin
MTNNANVARINELTGTLQEVVITLDNVKRDIETKQKPLEEQVITLTKKLFESERMCNNLRSNINHMNINYQTKFEELCSELEKSVSDRETLAAQLGSIL